MRKNEIRNVTIPSGATASNIIDKGGYAFVGFQFPAAMTGASITIEVSNSTDLATFEPVVDYTAQATGTALPAINFIANSNFQLWAEAGAFRYARFVSASSEAAARVFKGYFSS
jgi:hypothetical protein